MMAPATRLVIDAGMKRGADCAYLRKPPAARLEQDADVFLSLRGN